MKVSVRGLERVIRKLAQTGRGGVRLAVERGMMRSVLLVLSKMPAYPPPPPNSKYRRTMTLWRSITNLIGRHPEALSRVEAWPGGAVRGFVGTKLKYAPYVIDRERQAWMHVGRWWTLQGVVEAQKKSIVIEFVKEFTASVLRKFA